MAPKEESESTHPLPRPELNPLVNPLLGDNMGKWAEVYFTAPPEKREEAVLDLIRDLQSEGTRPEGTAKPQAPLPRAVPVLADQEPPSADFTAADLARADFATPSFARTEPQTIGHCYACGHENPGTHQFCGMCGEKLLAEEEVEGSPDGRFKSSVFDAPGNDGSFRREASPLGLQHDLPQRDLPPLHYDEPLDDRDELSHLRRISGRSPEDSADFNWNLEPPRPHRLYFGAAVVVVVLAVVYVAWRGSHPPKSAQQTSSPQPAAATQQADAPITTAKVDTPTLPAPLPPQPAANPATNPPHAQPTQATTNPEAPRGGNVVREQAPGKTTASLPPTSGTATAATPPASLGNGAEELALAQRYLSGGNGVQRNSAEAAELLWKSVAKHNSGATLLLADLYLRGDGVSKNCDQARVLLDSAARKGITGAGERLRNIQAFGCQ